MLAHDSRILQVILFGTLQKNLSALDFSLLAEEVDLQLTLVDIGDGQLHGCRGEATQAWTDVVRKGARLDTCWHLVEAC
jgi:hypothetical protein